MISLEGEITSVARNSLQDSFYTGYRLRKVRGAQK